MSLTAPGSAPPRADEPQILPEETIPAKTPLEALHRIHASTVMARHALQHIWRWLDLRDRNPEMHTVLINDGNTGSYQTLSQSAWPAKSIGVLNPGSAPVYIGIGGQSATSAARVPSCPGSSALVLPVQAQNVMLGCDPATLGSDTAVVFLFRFVTVQPLALRQA